MITLELSDEDILKYKAFCQHYELFSALLEADVFQVRQGIATLMFNRDGVLIKVRIEKESYQRKKKR
jgi:hypothetical protein